MSMSNMKHYDSKLHRNKASSFRVLSLLSVLTVVGISLPAEAAVLWELDAKFEDGGMATGTFEYHADTDTYSDIDLTVSGPAFLGGSVNFTDPSFRFGTSQGLLVAQSSFPLPFSGFLFDSALSNAGGTIDISLGTYGTIFNVFSSDLIALTSGTVTSINGIDPNPTEPAPEPVTILGTVVALGFGGLFKKKMSLNTSK